MKVRVAFVVDVDVEAYSLEYGVPVSDIREDVRTYCETSCRDLLGDVLKADPSPDFTGKKP